MNGSSLPAPASTHEQAQIRPPATPRRRALGRDGDVHQVPDLVVAASRPRSRAARRRRSPRGRCPTAWRARARTSPATTGSGRSGARSRSPPAGRCRRAGAPGLAGPRSVCSLERISLTPTLRVWRSEVDRVERPRSPSPAAARAQTWRAATRWTGSASSGMSDAAWPARDEIVPPPNRPPTGGADSCHQPLAELLGRSTPGSQTARRPRAGRGRRRPRRGSRRGRRAARRSPAASPIRGASASRVQTPRARPPEAPRALAVAIPTRRPVNEPGPSPTAIRSTASQPPPPLGRSARPRRAGAVACRGPAVRGEPELRLVEDLAVAPGAGGGVGGRGVEADDEPGQCGASPCDPEDGGADFLAFDEPGDLCRPGMVEVILFT